MTHVTEKRIDLLDRGECLTQFIALLEMGDKLEGGRTADERAVELIDAMEEAGWDREDAKALRSVAATCSWQSKAGRGWDVEKRGGWVAERLWYS